MKYFKLFAVVAILLFALAPSAWAKIITLTGSNNYTTRNGDVLTGSTSGTVTIANNASITLSDATITGGIVCQGSATITLVGTNSVSNVSDNAGIQIGHSGTTFTIRGSGSLTATGGSQAAGIGLGCVFGGPARPGSHPVHNGGSIVIEGGSITARSSDNLGVGIGTGYVSNLGSASIDGISIKGGTVNASLGKSEFSKSCRSEDCKATIGFIKIYDTVDMVDASKITEPVTYMHVDGESATDVTACKTDYFTVGEAGNRYIIVAKDDKEYTITIVDGVENGTLATAATAKWAEKVTVNTTPAFGYQFIRLIVKDGENNDVASTDNTFLMPKGNVTVSAEFAIGSHGTTEFAWEDCDFAWQYSNPDELLRETIYDGVTTVNIPHTRSYKILKPDKGLYLLLDSDIEVANIPYAGGTGAFQESYDPATYFRVSDYDETGYYDITLTDVGNGKWHVSILKTAAQMDVVPDQTYTGSAITPEPLVIAGSLSLTKGTDYVYSYENNTDVGTATVKATFQGDYASLGSVEKEFRIVKQLSHSDITVSDIPDQTYTGSAICPEVSVTDGETALILNTDYTVECSNNVNVGMATMTITGKGDYAGTVEKALKIVKQLPHSDITITDIPDQTYTGLAICPEISVTDGETALILNTDYTIECSNNTEVGTATMTITGMGNYARTVEKTFEIVPEVILASGAVQILEDENGTRAVIDGTYSGSEPVDIPSPVTVDDVVINRSFTPLKPATLVLPCELPEGTTANADFYQLADVSQKGCSWWADFDYIGEGVVPKANTPYAVVLHDSVSSGVLRFNLDGKKATCQTNKVDTTYVSDKTWYFVGVYSYKEWKEGNEELGLAYAFAGSDNEGGAAKGEFGKIKLKEGHTPHANPLRSYLRKKDSDVQLEASLCRAASVPGLSLAPAYSVQFIPEPDDVIEVEFVKRALGNGGANGGTTIIKGRYNTRTGEFKVLQTYDLKGRKLNGKPTAKGVYYGKKVPKK